MNADRIADLPRAERAMQIALMEARIETLKRELASRATPGWKLVPVEPTRGMEVAGGNVLKPHLDEPISNLPAARKTYRAMLSASPSPCEHEWTDMRNQVIQSGELCRKCGLMRESETKER